MSISLTASGKILLEGECPHEEAEQLLQLLLSTPGAVCSTQVPANLRWVYGAEVRQQGALG